MNAPKTIKVGIVGYGALGSALAQAILNKEPGFENYELIAVSDKYKNKDLPVPNLYGRLDDMAKRCDLLVEALPPDAAPELAEAAYKHGKPLVILRLTAPPRNTGNARRYTQCCPQPHLRSGWCVARHEKRFKTMA